MMGMGGMDVAMTQELAKMRVALEELVKIMNEVHKDLEELRKE